MDSLNSTLIDVTRAGAGQLAEPAPSIDAYRYWRAVLAVVEALDGLPGYPDVRIGTELSDAALSELRRLLEADRGATVDAGSTLYIQAVPWREGPYVINWLRARYGQITVEASGHRSATQADRLMKAHLNPPQAEVDAALGVEVGHG